MGGRGEGNQSPIINGMHAGANSSLLNSLLMISRILIVIILIAYICKYHPLSVFKLIMISFFDSQQLLEEERSARFFDDGAGTEVDDEKESCARSPPDEPLLVHRQLLSHWG